MCRRRRSGARMLECPAAVHLIYLAMITCKFHAYYAHEKSRTIKFVVYRHHKIMRIYTKFVLQFTSYESRVCLHQPCLLWVIIKYQSIIEIIRNKKGYTYDCILAFFHQWHCVKLYKDEKHKKSIVPLLSIHKWERTQSLTGHISMKTTKKRNLLCPFAGLFWAAGDCIIWFWMFWYR